MRPLIVLAAAFVLFALPARARVPSFPPPRSIIEAVDGVALISWENAIGADAVRVSLDRDDCPIAPHEVVDTGDPQQAALRVPAGVPLDANCLLRPGDHVSLMRYKDGNHIDTIGPYVVPVRLWFPAIR